MIIDTVMNNVESYMWQQCISTIQIEDIKLCGTYT